jgi:Domain of unknown function (DUF6265)
MKSIIAAVASAQLFFAALASAADPGANRLESVRWLTGRWQSPAGEGVACEEHWSAQAGGAMVGMFRLLNGDRPGVYELLLLEEEADGVWMRMRHFRPKMVAQEQEPIKLKLASATPDTLVFENPTDGRPKRVIYALSGDELTATVETEREGKPATFALKMQRVR